MCAWSGGPKIHMDTIQPIFSSRACSHEPLTFCWKDKRSEEEALFSDVEKAHEARVQEIAFQRERSNPNTHSGRRAQTAGSATRADKTERIGVTKWHPKRYEATPEGHFARLMRKKVGLQRRSFVHDPYKTRASKIIHGADFGYVRFYDFLR